MQTTTPAHTESTDHTGAATMADATSAAPDQAPAAAPAAAPAEVPAAAPGKPSAKAKAKVKAAAKPTGKRAAKPAAKPARKPAAKPAPVAPSADADALAAKQTRTKEKLVRDSFTMPRSDFALVQQLKDRAMGFQHAARKSELLRAGLHALVALDDQQLRTVLAALPTLKAGRPKKAD